MCTIKSFNPVDREVKQQSTEQHADSCAQGTSFEIANNMQKNRFRVLCCHCKASSYASTGSGRVVLHSHVAETQLEVCVMSPVSTNKFVWSMWKVSEHYPVKASKQILKIEAFVSCNVHRFVPQPALNTRIFQLPYSLYTGLRQIPKYKKSCVILSATCGMTSKGSRAGDLRGLEL